MKTNDEIMELVEKYFESACDNLWDALTSEERRQAFPKLISEYIGANY